MVPLEPLSIPILLTIGVVLIGLEMVLGSFYILWFGIGFFVVGAVEYFIPFSGAMYQIATALVISLVLLFTLKRRVKMILGKNEKEIKDDFLNEKGVGVIKEGMIFYKGTLWEYEPKNLHVKEGLHVEVLKTKGNIATIRLIK